MNTCSDGSTSELKAVCSNANNVNTTTTRSSYPVTSSHLPTSSSTVMVAAVDNSCILSKSIYHGAAVISASSGNKTSAKDAGNTSTNNATNSVVDYDSGASVSNGVGFSAVTNDGVGVITVGGMGAANKPQERYVWEMRARSPNVTPASTVLNSPDLNNDMQYSLHPHQRQMQQIRVGRSPGSQFEQHNILPQGLASPGSPTDVGKADGQCVRDGEIVVFDDIDTNWMNKTNSSYASNHNSSIRDVFHGNEDVLKVTKMIGQLAIAEYEGSPRRFGNQPPIKATFPKRPPGFPQRVSPLSSMSPQQQLQHQEQQEAAHARHQQMQQQHQFYAQATCGGGLAVGGSAANLSNSSMLLNHNTDSHKSVGNLIDIDADDGDAGSGGASATPVSSYNETLQSKVRSPTFDYLYEFSETRKVLEEFFKANADDEKRFTDFTESADDLGSCEAHNDFEIQQQLQDDSNKHIDKAYIGQRLARIPKDELYMVHRSPKKQQQSQQQQHLQQQQQQQQQQQMCDNVYNDSNDIELYIDSNSRSSGDLADTELEANLRRHSRNFTLSPETTDYDSNCGDLDSLSNDINCTTDFGKLYTSMPVLEDGLSSGHASDTENNCHKYEANGDSNDGCNDNASNENGGGSDIDTCGIELEKQANYQNKQQEMFEQNKYNNSLIQEYLDSNCTANDVIASLMEIGVDDETLKARKIQQQMHCSDIALSGKAACCNTSSFNDRNELNNGSNYEPIYASIAKQTPPPPPAPQPHRQMRCKLPGRAESVEIQEAMKEIRSALHRAKTQPEKLKFCDEVLPPDPESPIWVPRKTQMELNSTPTSNVKALNNCDEEEQDTDLETDRLLGQQRTDDQDFFEEKNLWPKTSRLNSTLNSNEQSPSTSDVTMLTSNSLSLKPQSFSSATIRQGIGTSLTPNTPDHYQVVGNADVTLTSPEKLQYTKSPTGSIKSLKDSSNHDTKSKTRNKEGLLDPLVLIEGVLFRARYLGSTQLVCEGQPTKSTRMMQAEEAVSRIKAPEGENQPSTEVDLFISTEKIMVLNTDLKEIMMDHALRTISYIADIGDLVVLMARRRFVHSENCNSGADTEATNTAINNNANGGSNKEKDLKENNASGSSNNKHNRTPKMICHVFESDEAQFIAQSIGQAFQVAYMEFLKANGIENENLAKEMDYQEVLNSQEIFGDELEIFAKKELQKEVVVPKAKGEILGVVIVESGWGSMLPTVVIANLMSGGAAARCGQLNIGDQLIAINGLSLVGLPLSTCQNYIRNAKNQTAVKFTVVPCPPVVEVKILRPKALFQLGFSVQNGVICSLLRGGIAERGGVRVGHRIIEINNQSVVAVPHDTIVKLLSSSVGEILMKTMPTSMFRLLTGQETPIYI
ncbi:X11L isoform 2-T3 [Glossina fuscipes fuscipes]